MARERKKVGAAARAAASRDTDRRERRRVWIEDKSGRSPFMRGIVVHSLMARGLAFDKAYAAAEKVRKRLRGREVVPRAELRKLIEAAVGKREFAEHEPPMPLPASILVTGGGREMPFSKGALSQSLLAASLDPNDAFDVAREIELELIRRGTQRITRAKLRKRSYQTLLQRFGTQTADRYLVWRSYQEPEKPVIILLGGTTGAGKTSLAVEVAHRLGISRVLSTDSIRQIMRIMLSEELTPAIHVSSFDAHRQVAPGVAPDASVENGFMAQASVVSVGVRAILDRAVSENTSLVLDGVALVPGLLDLDAYADSAHVIYLVVATLDQPAFRGRFRARGKSQSRRGKHRYLGNLDAILRIQEQYLELADRHNVPIVDNVSFDGSVMLIIRHVVESLRSERERKGAERS